MEIRNQNIEIEEAIKFADYESLLLKRRNNNMLLSDYQVNVLQRNGLNYESYGSIQQLLFDIEEYLNDNYEKALDFLQFLVSRFYCWK